MLPLHSLYLLSLKYSDLVSQSRGVPRHKTWVQVLRTKSVMSMRVFRKSLGVATAKPVPFVSTLKKTGGARPQRGSKGEEVTPVPGGGSTGVEVRRVSHHHQTSSEHQPEPSCPHLVCLLSPSRALMSPDSMSALSAACPAHGSRDVFVLALEIHLTLGNEALQLVGVVAGGMFGNGALPRCSRHRPCVIPLPVCHRAVLPVCCGQRLALTSSYKYVCHSASMIHKTAHLVCWYEQRHLQDWRARERASS